MRAWQNAITDVPGILVGHADDTQALTGCTVVLCPQGAVGGVDQRGGAPGTRQVDALRPVHLVQKAHAVMLAGGSAFGLDAASGAMRWLEEHGFGFEMRMARVPIVPSAILFDLGIGRADVRPDAAMGYRACLAASDARPPEGNAGAGMGCTVGKALGPQYGMKGGLGTASVELGQGVVVGAVAAVNAFGDILDEQGAILAGCRQPADPARFADALAVMRTWAAASSGQPGQAMPNSAGSHTVVGVVATNAGLTKEEANKVAQMSHDGLARVIRPAHTMFDGDTIFALSAGDLALDVNVIGAFAAEVMAQAILNGVRAAEPVAGWPAVKGWAARV
ncbi:MAG: P1 family peptidase [Anaerolineales bacterium]|nr:P1 family peptidase [Anaerolineales bacterium]